MSQTRARRIVVVANPDGLHVRAASLIAKVTDRVPAKIELVKGNHRVDASNVLQMLSLCALEGEQLLLEATGQDADGALELLARLFESQFQEDTHEDTFVANEPREQHEHRPEQTSASDVASDDNRRAR